MSMNVKRGLIIAVRTLHIVRIQMEATFVYVILDTPVMDIIAPVGVHVQKQVLCFTAFANPVRYQ